MRVIDTCANLSATDTGAQLPHAPGFRFAINIDSAMLQVYAAAGETEGTGGTGWIVENPGPHGFCHGGRIEKAS